MVDKDRVYYLYFHEKKKVSEIAKAENVSQPAITKILKRFPEYTVEKERRKEENKLKHQRQIAIYVNQRRKRLRAEQREEDEIIFAHLYELQKQNALSMSTRRTLSKKELVRLCLCHYRYDATEEKLFFIEDWGKRPADLPERVDVHGENILDYVREYKQDLEEQKWMSSTEQKVTGSG